MVPFWLPGFLHISIHGDLDVGCLNLTANFKVKYLLHPKEISKQTEKNHQIHRKSESKIYLPKNLEFLHSLTFLLPSLKVIFFSVSIMLRFSEKATKFDKILPLVLAVLSKRQNRWDFFLILWSSYNVWKWKWINFQEFIFLKGQVISEAIFLGFKSTKKQTIFSKDFWMP